MPKQLFCGDEEAGLFLFWCIFVVLLAGAYGNFSERVPNTHKIHLADC